MAAGLSARYSPCVGVCSATALGDPVCRGCGRTEAEIINWNSMPADARRAVWQRIGVEPFTAARDWVNKLEDD